MSPAGSKNTPGNKAREKIDALLDLQARAAIVQRNNEPARAAKNAGAERK